MFILDTNIISELRKSRLGKTDPGLLDWIRSVPESAQFLSVITLFELEYGVLLMEARDPEQGKRLRTWLEKQVRPAFEGRVLVVDEAVVRQGAKLRIGHPRPYRDSFIAATALVHGMTVVTRNLADFEPLGVPVFNPFSG
ncbi:MAG: type II toxin-antitoxin system VapC family toxin [Gammaproteobacteria bacterium]